MALVKLYVTGVVQGVGFRPFVYQTATRLDLRGWVANTSSGVEIELQGEESALDAFRRALAEDKPPLARVDSIEVQEIPPNGQPPYVQFEIRASIPQPGAFQPISPDISICPDCLRELFDPNDRRYRYPFINCTHCGPRFTIMRDIPYDRPLTTMAPFLMCADCAREYHDPLNRRFHAQPIACPKCGPQVRLEPAPLLPCSPAPRDPIRQARQLIAAGHIVAIKGLGGFHLACDATNAQAVQTLRERKGRVDKPFAVMAYDFAAVQACCYVSETERALLESRERPIVLLRRRSDAPIAETVAPHNDDLGVMLPYTPLHYMLLAEHLADDETRMPVALVMTSGNRSEEPIATDNADALERLAHLADYFLLHDREIETRADDSVVRVFEDRELPLRRSRGYAPYPVHLPFATRPTLAVGAELKNTFCVTRDHYAFVSQHIGDLENYPTLQSFETQIDHFKRLFRIEPEIIAHDLHPQYASTKYAQEASYKLQVNKLHPETLKPVTCNLIGIQHHHAHIAACMAENGLPDADVIGIAFDGTGYGTDGKIWGSEFLIARYSGFTRAAHLAYVPLPGGDAGIRRVYRGALAHLANAHVEWDATLPCVAAASENERNAIRRQLETGLNTPLTSSVGRLFDAVAAIIGVRETINYEAQAAIELEHWVVEDLESAYEFELRATEIPGFSDASYLYGNSQKPGISPRDPIIIDPAPVIRAVVTDYHRRVPPWVIATRFHNAVAEMVRAVAVQVRERTGLGRVALSGGVFQNIALLSRSLSLLREAGFEIYLHHLVPPNDAGISLGQAAVAAHFHEDTH